MKAAIVVLHFGDAGITRECLSSFGGRLGDVYLVLNGPCAEAASLTEGLGPGRVVALEKNLGFAGGVNRGISRALKDGYEWVMILNNDTALEEGFVNELEMAVSDGSGKKICFSPVILEREGKRVWFAGAGFSRITGRARHIDMGSAEAPGAERESDYLTGCALCFPKEAVEEAGLLDESYFLYWEDTDWSMKLRNRGYSLLVEPRLRIRHLGSSVCGLESGAYLYYYHRNQLRFLFKNLPCFLLPVTLTFFSLNLARMFLSWVLFHGKSGREKMAAVLGGVKDFLLSREGEKAFS